MPYDTDLSGQGLYFENFPVERDTRYAIPEFPGLGVDVDEERIRAETFKFWEAPRLFMQEGYYTYW